VKNAILAQNSGTNNSIITKFTVKSLPASLYKGRNYPSLIKRGEGRFYRRCPFYFEAVNKNDSERRK
jgi:hypothetical protein